jgi:signal transduction histidine kinase
VLAGTVLLASVVVSAFAVIHLNETVRQQVDRIDPAIVTSADLLNAVVDQETGVRGYVISRDRAFLGPYSTGVSEQTAAVARLHKYLAGDAVLVSQLDRVVVAAGEWRRRFAQPTIAAAAAGDPGSRSMATTRLGKRLFDRFRGEMGSFTAALRAAHASADANLTDADHQLIALLGVCLLAMLAVFEVTWILIRRWITAPIIGLATDVRHVAAGAFEHPIQATGSPEVHSLASDVDAMRERILSDLNEVEAARGELTRQRAALERSNRDLEHFAYVASHDLQEPLRKMSSFSELVVRRYGDRLDDRGREFLAFIAEGARRMQRLINDVLEVSKVGRSAYPKENVDLNDVVRAAVSNLSEMIADTGAVVSGDGLPTVRGDTALLVALMQNLIANSIKFRSEAVPRVSVSATDPAQVRPAGLEGTTGEQAEPAEPMWEIAVEDNGIGIAPDQAERVFAMFHRLHKRNDYPGTGIGLALCQRIVEHHGGSIWLDTSYRSGARVVFTLPAEAAEERTLSA